MSTANLESGQTTIGAAALTVVNQWSWWRAALKGEFGELKLGVPESGYYRWLQRDGSYKPVGIWRGEDGIPVAKVGERDVTPDAEWCERVFAYCCKHPITFQVYQDVMAGQPWPDAAPEKRLSNMPDDPFEAAKVDLAEEAELVAELLANPLNDTTAGRAASLADRIGKTGKKADETRAEEKKPHDDASKAVQAKWKPLVDQAATLTRQLKDAIGAHLLAKKRAAEEEERKRRQEEAKAREAAMREAEARGEPAPQPEPPVLERPKPVQTKIAGAEGRTIALRTERRAKIIDYPRAHAALASHPEMKDLVQTLANRAVKAGVAVDGVEVEDIQKAA